MLANASRSLVVENVCADAHLAALTVTRDLGIGAYSGVPLHRSDGRLYGTLCTLHPHARTVQPGEVALLTLAGRIIIQEVEAAALRARERRLLRDVAVSEERLRTVYAVIACGVVVIDAEARIVEANDAAQQILGLDLAALQGRTMRDIIGQTYDVDGAELAVAERPVSVAHATRRPQRESIMGITRLDGQRRWLQVDVIPVLDGDAIRHLVVSFIDITEQKRAEDARLESLRELERSNGELEQFAYVASHDLQEPLRTIASYVQLLGRRYQGRLDADADEFIAYAAAGAARLQTLINDLLAYSRVGTRGQPLSPTPCAAAVAAAHEALAAAIRESEAQITVGALPLVAADAGQLTQLFQNLLANALKFRRPGTAPVVSISAARVGAEWHIAVRDGGIGLDPAYAGRIFEIFQRLHTREEYEGTGIGLAICKKIAERHGGRLWVASQPGAGATFTLALPVCDEIVREAESKQGH